jgi:DNA-binding response OmpR family regulator
VNELVSVIEDVEEVRVLIRVCLKKERFQVREYSDGKGFLTSLATERPDLLVLDLMLPDMNGFDILRRLRASHDLSRIPVIILSARGEETDRLLGLSLGADDYVVKPFSPMELAVRVKAVLRRFGPRPGRTPLNAGGGLVIDADTLEVSSHGQRLELTMAEFIILQLLASRLDWVFPRQKILDYLWGNERNTGTRSVDVHMKHLRDKLGAQGKRIETIRGVGYKLLPAGTCALGEGDET